MKYIVGIIIGFTLLAGVIHRLNRDHIEATPTNNGLGVHGFSLTQIDGTPMPLSEYKGKIILIVNVASRCGLTPQYAELETLYKSRTRNKRRNPHIL